MSLCVRLRVDGLWPEGEQGAQLARCGFIPLSRAAEFCGPAGVRKAGRAICFTDLKAQRSD